MEKDIFKTARLIGRHLRPSDVDGLFAVYGDAEAMRWVGDGEPLDRAQCREWVAVSERNYRTRGYGMSALVDRADGQTIGFCGLVHPAGQAEAELKYAFRREHWGRGLATEAAQAMLAYAREELGLQHAIATAYPQNLASLRVLRKAGMHPAPTRTDADGTVICCFAWHADAPPATGQPHGTAPAAGLAAE
ncbi:GNAT family N-acetyltransferase [Xanthomonas bonasiae]|uniref:GNAT family N-acetyltransferase n=1 Tax=Xanthomonas bonasiae TaxID=2810351 RepID=UPI0017827CEF|nr:GNAT family N-acetyltransferase [Xanthomonas surreyensis]MBD7924041.1 GNAT family N-acetyltransferase [Xanthomonas surreyensis]